MDVWVPQVNYINADGEDCDWSVICKTEKAAKRELAEYITDNLDMFDLDGSETAVETLGIENISDHIAQLFEKKEYDAIITMANTMIEEETAEITSQVTVVKVLVLEKE
jgi:hypothetical protein